MKIKKIHLSSVIFTFLLSLIIIYYGCNKSENPIIEPTQDFNMESSASKNTSEAQNLCSDMYYYLVSLANGITINTNGCPTVTVDSASGNGGKTYTININFGTSPCSTFADGLRRSGRYIITGFINDARDSVYGSISFPTDNPYRVYTVYSSTFDTNYVQVTNTSSSLFTFVYGKKVNDENYTGTFTTNLILTTNTGIQKTINLLLTANVNLGVIGTPWDETFQFKGAGAIIDNRYAVQFGYVISDSLTITTSCRYPVRGKVAYTIESSGGQSFTYVDFYPETGGCDGVITLIKFGIYKTVTLDSFEN